MLHRTSLVASLLLAPLLWIGLAPTNLTAQAPFSGRVLPAREAQLRIDLQSHVAPTDRGGWVWGLPGVSLGLPRGVEIGVGLSATNPRTSTDLTLSAKWAPLAHTTSPVQVAVGAMTLLPTQRDPGGAAIRPMTLPYLALTTPLLPSLGEASPVLTVAAYGVDTPRPGPFGDRAGGMIGVDQGLPYGLANALGMDAAQLSVNWVTGKTLFGYASGAVTFLKGNVNISVGYARGNLAQFNHGPTFGIGVAF
jgi:hypothetical protein